MDGTRLSYEAQRVSRGAVMCPRRDAAGSCEPDAQAHTRGRVLYGERAGPCGIPHTDDGRPGSATSGKRCGATCRVVWLGLGMGLGLLCGRGLTPHIFSRSRLGHRPHTGGTVILMSPIT
eukprot:2023072-Prymnesium_polylepis.2